MVAVLSPAVTKAGSQTLVRKLFRLMGLPFVLVKSSVSFPDAVGEHVFTEHAAEDPTKCNCSTRLGFGKVLVRPDEPSGQGPAAALRSDATSYEQHASDRENRDAIRACTSSRPAAQPATSAIPT